MFKSLFKGKEKTPSQFVEDTLTEFLEQAGFLLSIQVTHTKEEIKVDIFGEEEALLKAKQGRLILALQTYLNCALQNHFTGQNQFVRLDSGGFFEEKEKKLLELTEKLKQKVLNTGRPVYFKQSLSPSERRKIHQTLNLEKEVTTSSHGEGFLKRVCISPKTK